MNLNFNDIFKIKHIKSAIFGKNRYIHSKFFEEEKRMNKIPLFLLILGGLNTGCIGLVEIDIIASVCGGSDTIAARFIYCILSACAIWSISFLFYDEGGGTRINITKIRRRRW